MREKNSTINILRIYLRKWFSTYYDKKAAVVERFNRTIKEKMHRYFMAKETNKWFDILGDLVKGYNNSFHSSIEMKPVDARKEEAVWYNLYGAYVEETFGKHKYRVGDAVRINKYKSIFDKGYLQNFTEKVFKIKQVIFTKPIVHNHADYQSDAVDGYFYEEESSYVPNPDQFRVQD
jgi:hypothetical protein